MRVFEEEEKATKAKAGHTVSISEVMDAWESKGVWFWHCVSSVSAMYFLLETHLYPPKSLSVEAERIVSWFWCLPTRSCVLSVPRRGSLQLKVSG